MHALRTHSVAIAAVIVVSLHGPAALAGEPVRSVEIVEASAFLEEYRVASEAQNVEFYDLYSDRADVHARVQDREQGIAFQGRAFKTWGRELLKEGKTGLDGSIFREATVEQRGSRLLIRAKRYSTTRCYWDPTYQVGIEREGATYRIVDERLTTNPTAHCLAAHISTGAAQPSPDAVSEATSGISDTSARKTDSLGPEWRSLSEQELADKSMRLAQQLAAARASLPGPDPATSPSVMASATPPRVSLSRPAAAEQGDVANALRITPQAKQ